jgi:DNA-binding NarL/FixJ family response regulator
MEDIIKIIIVDDHTIFKTGLEILLNRIPHVKVIGDADSREQLFNLLGKNIPDIIFMDINLGYENGIKITKEVLSKYPAIKVIALTMSEEVTDFNAMLSVGASGFLLKNVKEKELSEAIEMVMSGESYFSKEFLILARQQSPVKTIQSKITLSEREREVLSLICTGYSNQQIAEKIHISIHTVDGHRRSLFYKTGATNVANLVMIAFQNGLFS